jgi:FkbM family methyltransferase
MVELLGAAGLRLYICKHLHINCPPVTIPVFGRISTSHEIRNIFDNFGTGEIRNKAVEDYLSAQSAPCIVDCGVNVGVTVRWWLHLNARAKVYGIDMLQEAQDFTVEALKTIKAGGGNYVPVTAALWSLDGREFKIGVSDPLYGDYGFYRPDKEKTERTVVTRTLDSIAGSERIGATDLLKIDLEGAAADALQGASELIKRTRFIVFEIHEIHNREERSRASKILTDGGFVLIEAAGRHLWWEKKQ